MLTTIRILVVVLGFAMIVGAEFLERRHLAKPWATGNHRADVFMDDAKVMTLRVFGGFISVLSLISFVIQNHAGPAPH